MWFLYINPYATGTVYMRFRANLNPINSTRISKKIVVDA